MSDISDLDKTADSLRRAGAAVREHALAGNEPTDRFHVQLHDYVEDEQGGWSGTMTTTAHNDTKYEAAYSPETGRVAIDVVKNTETIIVIDHKVQDNPDYRAEIKDKPYFGMATD